MLYDMSRSEMTQAIAELAQEAASAGDSAMVRDCQRANRPNAYGHKASRARCEPVILANRLNREPSTFAELGAQVFNSRSK